MSPFAFDVHNGWLWLATVVPLVLSGTLAAFLLRRSEEPDASSAMSVGLALTSVLSLGLALIMAVLLLMLAVAAG